MFFKAFHAHDTVVFKTLIFANVYLAIAFFVTA